eukprot:GHVN01024444.1.p1 GENE.GHVN01024444.1~~GHVN01024444.1.p1  ORF type:complete len:562 (+),score=79.37 GHVN01024444.1:2068-3753(+)
MAGSDDVQDVKQQETQALVKRFLNYTIADCFIPELGESLKGKVRNVYFTKENVIIIASDRVSAFDEILPNLIPFKGAVLTQMSLWAFEHTKDICPNAVVNGMASDPNVIVQKRLRNINFECIVRGYLWGSMAAAYEKGERTFCGHKLPDGLKRYDKLSEPLFTPTTKAEQGQHDENVTFGEMEKTLGKAVADKARQYSMALFKRGQELANAKGLILIDTKYEFGLNNEGEMMVIDEVNTPDSSRYCDVAEWESKTKLINEKLTGTVNDLLKQEPSLKIVEMSKQYVRDILLEAGFQANSGKKIPQLNEEQVIEAAYRYLSVYQRFTGSELNLLKALRQSPTLAFDAHHPHRQQETVPEIPENGNVEASLMAPVAPRTRLVQNMMSKGVIKGCCVAIFAGSGSDLPHLQKIQDQLNSHEIPNHIRICSAHKQPGRLEAALRLYNTSLTPLLIVACAGGTDALSGTASFLSHFPVVTCPPPPSGGGDATSQLQAANSCLTNPPGSSNAFILRPDNVARFALQVFSCQNTSYSTRLHQIIDSKVRDLECADDAHYKRLMQLSWS